MAQIPIGYQFKWLLPGTLDPSILWDICNILPSDPIFGRGFPIFNLFAPSSLSVLSSCSSAQLWNLLWKLAPPLIKWTLSNTKKKMGSYTSGSASFIKEFSTFFSLFQSLLVSVCSPALNVLSRSASVWESEMEKPASSYSAPTGFPFLLNLFNTCLRYVCACMCTCMWLGFNSICVTVS